MHTFRPEHVTNDNMRYYLETGGNKCYLMVGSDGNIITLNANDLVLGSQNDALSRYPIWKEFPLSSVAMIIIFPSIANFYQLE